MATKLPGRPCEREDYGTVVITRGRWKGTIGLYDDDDEGGAIVYLDHPVRDHDPREIAVPRRWLRRLELDFYAFAVQRSRARVANAGRDPDTIPALTDGWRLRRRALTRRQPLAPP